VWKNDFGIHSHYVLVSALFVISWFTNWLANFDVFCAFILILNVSLIFYATTTNFTLSCFILALCLIILCPSCQSNRHSIAPIAPTGPPHDHIHPQIQHTVTYSSACLIILCSFHQYYPFANLNLQLLLSVLGLVQFPVLVVPVWLVDASRPTALTCSSTLVISCVTPSMYQHATTYPPALQSIAPSTNIIFLWIQHVLWHCHFWLHPRLVSPVWLVGWLKCPMPVSLVFSPTLTIFCATFNIHLHMETHASALQFFALFNNTIHLWIQHYFRHLHFWPNSGLVVHGWLKRLAPIGLPTNFDHLMCDI